MTDLTPLMIAHDLGQVGDLLEEIPDSALSVYPTIARAVAAGFDPSDG